MSGDSRYSPDTPRYPRYPPAAERRLPAGTGCGLAARGPAGAWGPAASCCPPGPAASCCWAAPTPTAPSRTRTSWSWVSAGGRGAAGASPGPHGALTALTPPAVPAGSLRWAQAGWSGLRPRYEHATFLPPRQPPRLWVFGGADQAGNRSCVQALDPGE